MKPGREQWAGRRFIRYVVIGGSVYIFEMLVILVAQRCGASALWAVTLSYLMGALAAFGLQKFVTFGDRRRQHRVVLAQLLATGALVLCNLLFTVILTKLLANHLPAVVIRTMAIAMTTAWNFYLYKTSIFKASDKLVY